MAATKSSGSETEILLPPIVTQPPAKKKRSLAGHPDPDAEVIALSPRSLLATNRFVCEVCNKGFQRDQNLQLHRRGHNLPWTLKHKSNQQVRKKVYICPEKTCIYHDPSRALGDLTGIKKHYSRKHGEKKWKCEKCSKKYAVQSDWKAHQKVCGTREYHCDCGTLFSRKDSFITHRAFCDALAENNVKGSLDTEEDSQPPTTSTDNNTGANGASVSTAMDFTSSPASQITGDGNTVSDVSKSNVKPENVSEITLSADGNAMSSKRCSLSIETSTEGNALSSKPSSANSDSNPVQSQLDSSVETANTEGNASLSKPTTGGDRTNNDGDASPSKWAAGGIKNNSDGTVGGSRKNSEGNASPMNWTPGGISNKSERSASSPKWTPGGISNKSERSASSPKWTPGGISNKSERSASSPKWTPGMIRNSSDGDTSPPKWTPGVIKKNKDEKSSSPKWTSGVIRNNNDGNALSPKWTPGVIRNNNDGNALSPKWTPGVIRNNNDGNALSPKWTPGVIRNNSDGKESPPKWTTGVIRANGDGNASPSKWTPGVIRNNGDGNVSPSKWTPGVIRINNDGNASPSQWTPGVVRNSSDGNSSPSKWTPGVIRNNSDGNASPTWTTRVIRNNNDGNVSPSKWTPGINSSNRDGNTSPPRGTSGGVGPNSDTLNKAPALSLSLGTGHGPGPPSVVPEGRASSDTSHGFAMQSPRTAGFSGFLTSESPKTSTITLPPSGGAMEKLASILSSTKSYSRHDYDNGNMSSNRTGFMYASMKPAGSSVSVPSMMGEYGPMRPSSGSASMSATALLQKAAQMGATSTNLSLFQKFGVRGGDSSSGGTQTQASWSGYGNTFSGSSSTYMKTSKTGDLNMTHDYNMAYTNTVERVSTSDNKSGLPVESRYYSSPPHGMTYPFETVTQGINLGMMRDREPSTVHNNVSAVDNGIVPRLNTQRREHDGDRQMLDFLGVEGHSGVIQGSNAGIDRILSHKDLARINSFGGRIEVGKNPSLPA